MLYGVLGPLKVLAHDGTELVIRGYKQRALLTLLLLGRGRPVPVDRLLDVLWGDQLPGNPMNALQAQVSQLRKSLGAGSIRSVGAAYALALDNGALDIDVFEELVENGRVALDLGDAARAVVLLQEGLALWRGDVLADVDDPDVAAAERVRLEELRVTALEAKLQASLDLGRHRDVVAELEVLVVSYPLRERLWELLMLALYRSGRQADALRAYQHARDILVDELGIEPGAALRQLESRILGQDADLEAPVRSRLGGNVGAALSRIIGRDAEVDHVIAATAEHRLVTIVGPGGAGKTRLAVEVARRDSSPGGSWLVALEAVTDPDAVLPSIAAALGLRDDGLGGAGAVRAAERIASQLSGRPALLVLDNCEHLVEPAAHAAADLLGMCSTLRLLATSREPLGLPGEILIPLGPLKVGPAAELFIERARAVQPDLSMDDEARVAVDEICRRLDGLPLALELAAARTRSLPLTQIAERLNDRFDLLAGGSRTALPRQQTLRAVVDWSYDLLFDDERRLFDRVSVFSGGCTIEAAEAVCGDDLLPRDEIVELLSRLVEKSLLVPQLGRPMPRYRMLQTLRYYGREHLLRAEEAESLRERHAAHYLALASRLEPHTRSGNAIAAREQLAPELENLWAALDYFVDQREAASALQLSNELAWLWFLIGDWSEGARFCQRALGAEGAASPASRGLVALWSAYYQAAASGHRSTAGPGHEQSDLDDALTAVVDGGDPVATVKALHLRTSLSQRRGDPALHQQFARSGLVAAEACGDRWLIATGQMLAALSMLRAGCPADAGDLAAAAVATFDELGDQTLSIEAGTVLLTVAELEGRLEEALRSAQRILAAAEETAIPGYRQWALSRLAFLQHVVGDLDAAHRAHTESLAIGRSPWGDALALVGLALIARDRGRLDEARAHLDTAVRVYDELGASGEAALGRVLAGWVELDRGDLPTAQRLASEATGVVTTSGDPGVSALASEVLAAVAVANGDRSQAKSLLLPSVPIGIPAGHGLWLLTRRDGDRVRAAVGDEAPAGKVLTTPPRTA